MAQPNQSWIADILNRQGIPSQLAATVPTPTAGGNAFVDTGDRNVAKIKDTAGKVHEIAYAPWVDVRTYGAMGDGVTDDTAAIQNAITAALANKIGHVLVPAGTYLCTSQITIPGACFISGVASGMAGGVNANANAFPTIIHNFSGDMFVFNAANGGVQISGGGLDSLRLVQAFGSTSDGVPRGRAVKVAATDDNHVPQWIRLSCLIIEEAGKSPWTWAIDMDGSACSVLTQGNARISEVSSHTGTGALGAVRLFCVGSVKLLACEFHNSQANVIINGTAGKETIGVQLIGGDAETIQMDYCGTVAIDGGTYSLVTTTAHCLAPISICGANLSNPFVDTSGTQAAGAWWYDGTTLSNGAWRTTKPIALPPDVALQGLNGTATRNLVRYDPGLGAVELASDGLDFVTVGTMPGSVGGGVSNGSLVLPNAGRICFVKNDGSAANRCIQVSTDTLNLGIDAPTVTINAAGGTQLTANTTGLAFYGGTPVAQASRVGALTDSTTGTPSTTIGDVGAAFSQAGLNNIHASLLAKINALELALHNIRLTA